MATTELLSAVKVRKNLKNFSELARLIGITRQSVHRYRQKATFLDDEQALRVAEILRIDAGAVLAAIHAERATCSELRQVWLDVSICCDGGKTLAMIATYAENDIICRKSSAA